MKINKMVKSAVKTLKILYPSVELGKPKNSNNSDYIKSSDITKVCKIVHSR